MVGGEAAEVGDHGHEHALHAGLIKGAREMVVIDEVMSPAQTDDGRHHVRFEEPGQILRALLPPGVALLMDLDHAERDLGRPKAEDGRGVEDGFAKGHWNTGAAGECKASKKCLI